MLGNDTMIQIFARRCGAAGLPVVSENARCVTDRLGFGTHKRCDTRARFAFNAAQRLFDRIRLCNVVLQ